MYTVKPTTRFQKDLKLAAKRGYQIDLLTTVIKTLAAGESLAETYKDHPLKGNYTGCRECHITPDWLLIYEVSDKNLILYLTRTGTHSDLF
jgi:addiction module toxin, RelE/StbE family